MPTFRPKSSKKIKFNKKSAVTLDTKHKEFLNEFSKDENIVIDYKCQIQILKKKLEEEGEQLSIEEILDIKDNIYSLKEIIKDTKMKSNII